MRVLIAKRDLAERRRRSGLAISPRINAVCSSIELAGTVIWKVAAAERRCKSIRLALPRNAMSSLWSEESSMAGSLVRRFDMMMRTIVVKISARD